ncbi:hypothetical protein PCC8801_0940 [Rippkaea orientalis PCC 8801]|uniref:Uncharacterized protein n=1 Tax=Rippkaea orientalis (strain PCC 8801 / RF-1) TaxID=41431 RepID=B7JZS4_RIPO1|nr:hypothetical protein [Rippkaea orientalis]ACK65017.1 hypothetical protein PCC8801_0940 [Rippkaea orientalis PCC 8801]
MTEQEQLAEIKALIQSSIDQTNERIDHLAKELEGLKQETLRTNDRVETYQKASQQVVNLAFSLIIAATAAIIIPAIFGK